MKEEILFCLTPNKKLAFVTKEQIKTLKFLLLFFVTICKNILKKIFSPFLTPGYNLIVLMNACSEINDHLLSHWLFFLTRNTAKISKWEV